MTTEESQVTTTADLEAEIGALLRAAHDAGVDIEGGWDCRSGSDRPDWDVVVTEVEPRASE